MELRNSLLPRPTLLAPGGFRTAIAAAGRCREAVSLPPRLETQPEVSSMEPFRLSLDLSQNTGISPWTIPGSLRLAGGRPQLTAGIRAGSYAHECINLATQRQSNRADFTQCFQDLHSQFFGIQLYLYVHLRST